MTLIGQFMKGFEFKKKNKPPVSAPNMEEGTVEAVGPSDS